MRRAAEIWAAARQRGRPTAADAALDGDVILAGQATTRTRTGLIVATTNVRHLSRFVPAALWSEIA
jgi:predicted nucleic acid-binding protein